MPEVEIRKATCTKCGFDINHYVRGFYKKDPKERDLYENNEYRILQCAGCEQVSFVHSRWDNDAENEEDFAPHETEYPRYDFGDEYGMLQDEEADELPRKIYDLYEELRITLNNDAETLRGLAMRLLIEAICIHQKIGGRTLKDKIDNLFNNGYLSSNDLEIIQLIRELGNKSAHEIKALNQSELVAALEAVNHLLRSVYIVPKRTKKLRNLKKSN